VCVCVCVTVRTNNNNKPQKKEDKLKTTTKNIIHSLFFMFMPSYFCHVMILSYKRFSVVVANQHTLPHFNTHTHTHTLITPRPFRALLYHLLFIKCSCYLITIITHKSLKSRPTRTHTHKQTRDTATDTDTHICMPWLQHKEHPVYIILLYFVYQLSSTF